MDSPIFTLVISLFLYIVTGDIDIWDTKNHRLIKTITGDEKKEERPICCESQRNRLFCGYLNGYVKVWDIRDPKKPYFFKTLQGDTYPISKLAYSAEKNILFSGYMNQTIEIWNTKTYCLIKTIEKTHRFSVKDLTYNAKENFFFSVGFDNIIKVWGVK